MTVLMGVTHVTVQSNEQLCPDVLMKAIIRRQARSHGRKYRRWQRELLILDVQDGTDETLGERIPSSGAETAFQETETRLLLHTLPHPDREVLYDLYVLGWSQKDVARDLHISQSNVSRIKQHGIRSLRQELDGG